MFVTCPWWNQDFTQTGNTTFHSQTAAAKLMDRLTNPALDLKGTQRTCSQD